MAPRFDLRPEVSVMTIPTGRPAPLACVAADRTRRTTPDRGPDRTPMTVGVVVFLTHRKEEAEAILDDQGTWRCPELPVLDRVLNALYAPTPGAKTDAPFGYAELIRVAAWLKGEVKQAGPAGKRSRGPLG